MCACVLVVQRGEDRHGTLVKGECEWMGVVQVCVCVCGDVCGDARYSTAYSGKGERKVTCLRSHLAVCH